ncbi:MAG: hypothetical protein ABR567_11480 [Myxococcales bacterium]
MTLLLLGLMLATGPVAVAEPAAPASFEVPGGHLFAGIGAWGASSPHLRDSDPVGVGISLDALFQTERLLLGLSAQQFSLGDNALLGAFAGARVGAILTEGRDAPYIAAGFGYLAEGHITGYWAEGAAATAEAGILLFRDRRWGQMMAAVQAHFPLFRVAELPGSAAWRPQFAAGLRFLL